MSNLTWLTEATAKKAKEIIDLSDEYWDVILDDIEGAPDDVKQSPHSLGKLAIVSTLGLMMYLPGNAEQFANSFGRDSHLETGASHNTRGGGYSAKVSQGVEAASRIVGRWVDELDEAPAIGSSETTDDLRQFMPLFEEMLSTKANRVKKAREEEQAMQKTEGPSLLSLEEV